MSLGNGSISGNGTGLGSEQDFFKFREKERGERYLFSKACRSLYRRRFKEFEDAPFAAYDCYHNILC